MKNRNVALRKCWRAFVVHLPAHLPKPSSNRRLRRSRQHYFPPTQASFSPRTCPNMSLFDDYVEQNIGIHPAAQLQAAFLVPTPPTDNNLLLFTSASSFCPADAVPLEPWLKELAALVLGNAVAAGEKLRLAVAGTDRACDAHPPRSFRPPTSDGQADGQPPVTLGTPAVLDNQAGTGRSGHETNRATGTASGKGADLTEAWRGAPRHSNQVVARGLKSVDDLVLASDDGWKRYAPTKGFLRRAGGKLGKAQVNLLSKGNTVMKKIREMWREELQRSYEVAVDGKVPTLLCIRFRIEQENGQESARGTKRGRSETATS